MDISALDPKLLYIMGGAAALISAASWAFTSILWHWIGEKISPTEMNMGKCIMGIVYLGAVMLIFGLFTGHYWDPIDTKSMIFFAISGILGVTLADTFFFASLKYLAPRLAGILQTLCVVFIIIGGVLFLGDRPSYIAWIGMLITIAGVTWVVWERAPREALGSKWKIGILYGLGCVITTAISVLCAKMALAEVSALQGTFVRIVWGLLGLAVWGLATRRFKKWLMPLTDFPLIKSISFAVFVAIIGGFWFSLAAVKYMTVSVASTLNTTDPLFMLPMAAIFLKEKLSGRAIWGAVFACAGVAVIFMDKYIIQIMALLGISAG